MLSEEITTPSLSRYENNKDIQKKAQEMDSITVLTVIGGPLILRYQFRITAKLIGISPKNIRLATVLAFITFFIEVVVFIMLPRIGLPFGIIDALLVGRFFSLILLVVYNKLTEKHIRLAKFYHRTEEMNVLVQIVMGIFGILAELLLLAAVGLVVGATAVVAILFLAIIFSGNVLSFYLLYKIIKFIYKKLKGRKNNHHEQA
ncbi:MAG TPA: hypothetical protein VIO64_16535 [Pseudobacteroides sp.]|uniref:hypothetical protein n=1 Tax=Pseudobacteroides sp. TaxID=1968840 RepID=UPI002F959DEC